MINEIIDGERMTINTLAGSWPFHGSLASFLTREQTLHFIKHAAEYEKQEAHNFVHIHGKIKAHAEHFGLDCDGVPDRLSAKVENYVAHYERSKLPGLFRMIMSIVRPLEPLP